MKKITLNSKKAPRNAKKTKGGRTRTPEQVERYRAIRQSIAADKSKLHEWRPEYEAFTKPAEKEFRRAKRAYNAQLKKNKAIDITKNKLEAEYGRIETEPDYIDRSIAAIADKVNEYYNTSSARRDKLSEITGLDMKDFDTSNTTKRKQALVEALYRDLADDRGIIEIEPAVEKVTDIYRGLESFNRKERLHAKGIEMDMDEETAKDVMKDILSSDKVSAETKEVLRILGPKGALLYVNYRQIQKLKYGDLYREQLYAPAAEIFWDNSEADKILLKKFGYRFSNKAAKVIDENGAGTAGHIDATQFQKFAMTKMNKEEAEEFLKKISASHI